MLSSSLHYLKTNCLLSPGVDVSSGMIYFCFEPMGSRQKQEYWADLPFFPNVNSTLSDILTAHSV